MECELSARDEVINKVKKELEKIQGRMKRYFNQERRDEVFEPVQYLHLQLQPYQQKSLNKEFNVRLLQWYYMPFKILEWIGEVAFKVDLPPISMLHPEFHVTMLKKRKEILI
ncbi:hypothetical protein Nepgr_024868 [Nepenthes gracilis]|uniref:Tf2-1-like SH3-like domain-containing protein n=1 Tax=Nepenthes gracilis TaxID=150966 RepID=A0AAD3Y0H8_NEPGR|nr:hypothetical protein Nepgr_024868 [Nepenthes gracilis]